MLCGGFIFDNSSINSLIPSKRKKVTKILKNLQRVFMPLKLKSEHPFYMAGLCELRFHKERRAFTEDKLVMLCIEFIISGMDTIISITEWALIHLIDNQLIYEEIGGAGELIIDEEVAKGMSYLQATFKKTLRRHLPTHFLVNHVICEASQVRGYRIPAGSRVNFYVYGMAMDPSMWENPEGFRPERFLEEGHEMDMTVMKNILFDVIRCRKAYMPGHENWYDAVLSCHCSCGSKIHMANFSWREHY